MDDPRNPKSASDQGTSLRVGAARRVLTVLHEVEVSCADDVSLPEIPGYVLHARLGRGGGGEVYLGRRAGGGSDAPVAIKLLNAQLPPGFGGSADRGSGERGPEERRAGGEGNRRAWRELGLLADLRLPSLPRLLDYGVAGGRLYLVTEFIDGVTLDEFCLRGCGDGEPLDRRARVELLVKVADAVQSLHEHGVIHRDLKPSNVLIDGAGNPVIIDLGIAALLADNVMQTLTADGAPIGTPAFMAPEQARGERSAISTRSDVYALGATAYQVLTGSTPHDLAGVTLAEAVHRVAHGAPRSPQELEASLPRPLAAVLTKACDPSPARRYETAAALADDLRRWLRGEPVEASPPGMWLRGARWVGRHPVVTTAAACTAVGGAILGATMWSVRWVSMEAVSYKVTEQPSELQVLARNGAVVHRWTVNDATDYKNFVEFIDAPREFGLGRVAVGAVYGPDNRSFLAVWKHGDFERPIWSTLDNSRPFKLPHWPEERWQTNTGEIRVSGVTIADVFPGPEHPGEEIIATFHGQHHPTAIRVYNLAGDVLFEAWHPGICGEPYWIPDAGQIVLAGCNGETSWLQLGYPVEIPGEKWPRVVFAIQPRPGLFGGWIRGDWADPAVAPKWYKFLTPWPRSMRDIQTMPHGAPYDVTRAGDCVRLAMGFKGGGEFDWTVDRHGNIVDESLHDSFDLRFNPTGPAQKVRPSEFIWLTDRLLPADESPPIRPLPPPVGAGGTADPVGATVGGRD